MTEHKPLHFHYASLRLLKTESILEGVTPATILATFAQLMSEAIRRDMTNCKFLDECRVHAQTTGRRRWTLSIAKVPKQLRAHQAMRHLMRGSARQVSRNSGQSREQAGIYHGDYRKRGEGGRVYDEFHDGYGGSIECRYADFRLALSELVMHEPRLATSMPHAGKMIRQQHGLLRNATELCPLAYEPALSGETGAHHAWTTEATDRD